MCLLGSQRVSTKVLQESYGPCASPGCGGTVDLVEKRVVSELWFIPVGTDEENVVRCRSCGNGVRAVHYDLQRKYGAGADAGAAGTAAAQPVIVKGVEVDPSDQRQPLVS